MPRSAALEAMTNLTGRRIASFELGALLGVGAMGVVYLARDTVLRRDVALKLIAKGNAETDPERRERFLREARAAARLVHPHVVQIFQLGEDQGLHFLAMEYVEGVTLARAAKQRGGRLPEQLAIEKMRDAAAALSAAAASGICHRDIKPANLLLTSAGALKVADFGLASYAGADDPCSHGLLQGTPFYMSPEHWSGGPTAPSADIYSLGCTFYHLLVGHPPYAAADLTGYIRAHCAAPVRDPRAELPELDPLLCDLIHRSMAKRAHERPSADEIVEVLDDMILLRRRGHPRAEPPSSMVVAARDHEAEATQPVPVAAHLRRGSAPPPRRASDAGGSLSYGDFFGLRGFAFSDNRQPACFWDGGPHAAALRALASQILGGQRPATLVGAPGSGRTFVCEMLSARFPRVHVLAVEPQLLFGASILVSLAQRLGVAVTSGGASRRFLYELILARALPADDPRAVAALVIDGVDPDDRALLAQLDDIAREAPAGRLALVLVGSEGLTSQLLAAGAPARLLAGPPPVPLRPLTLPEMAEYIAHRLRRAGAADPGIPLDLAGQQLLHARSFGNPKLVNVYCHNALTVAAASHERVIKLGSLRAALRTQTYLTPEAAAVSGGG